MSKTPYSDFIPVGGSVRLVSVRSFASEIGTSIAMTRRLLARLEVPILRPLKLGKPHPYDHHPRADDDSPEFFNLWSLELSLHALLRPGQFGYVPGARHRMSSALKSIPELQSEVELVSRYYGHLDKAALRTRLTRLATAIRRCATTEAAAECARLKTRIYHMDHGTYIKKPPKPKRSRKSPPPS